MQMKMNLQKTKFMVFNPTSNFDFIPEHKEIETNEEMKLLGLVIRNDLSWKSNTEQMIKRAYKRLWIVKRLIMNGACRKDLIDVYAKQVRSILEFGVPVWHPNLTERESKDIERVQKSFLHMILGTEYVSYEQALEISQLEKLAIRRTALCYKFALKASKHPKHMNWFVKTDRQGPNTRRDKMEYKQPIHRLVRYQKSPIPYLTNLLNKHRK